jgi:hypothetical protein
VTSTTKRLLLGSLVLAGAATFTILPALSGSPFDGSGQSGVGGGGPPSVSMGGNIYLNHPTDTVYLQYDGGSIGLVGAEVDVPNGFTDSQKVNADTIITPLSIVAQAPAGQAAFKVAQTGARVYFDVGGNIYCASDGSQVVCASAWIIPSLSVETIGSVQGYTQIFSPTPYPSGSLTACSSGRKGALQTLSGDGRPYQCNGTSNQTLSYTSATAWSGNLNFSVFSGQGCQTLTFTATGAVADEPIAGGGCGSVYGGDGDLTCNLAITATNTASVRLCCIDITGCADLAAITFSARPLR